MSHSSCLTLNSRLLSQLKTLAAFCSLDHRFLQGRCTYGFGRCYRLSIVPLDLELYLYPLHHADSNLVQTIHFYLWVIFEEWLVGFGCSDSLCWLKRDLV